MQGFFYAHARVADLEHQPDLGGRARHAAQADDHMAGLSELDGIADEIAQYLADAHRIAQHRHGHLRVHAGKQQQAVLLRHGGIGAGAVLHQLPGIERGLFQLQLARLDLAGVQDVADDLQQDGRGGFDTVHILALQLRELGQAQQLQRAQRAIQRRADFVAHGRQKGGLCLVGLVRRDSCPLQIALDFRARTDVGKNAQRHILAQVAGGRIGHIERTALRGDQPLHGSCGPGVDNFIQRRPVLRRAGAQVAIGRVQPLLHQRIPEDDLSTAVGDKADSHGGGFDQRPVELIALDDDPLRFLGRRNHLAVEPAGIGDTGQQAQQQGQHQAGRRGEQPALEKGGVVHLVVAGPPAGGILGLEDQAIARVPHPRLVHLRHRAGAHEHAEIPMLQPEKMPGQRMDGSFYGADALAAEKDGGVDRACGGFVAGIDMA